MNIPAHGHPTLTREQLLTLAECVASMDGITVSVALRQIASFMNCDLHSATTSFLSAVTTPAASSPVNEPAAAPMAQQCKAR